MSLTALKPDIIEDMVKNRDEELDERKEKRRKVAEEEKRKREEYEEEMRSKGLDDPFSINYRPPPPDPSKVIYY